MRRPRSFRAVVLFALFANVACSRTSSTESTGAPSAKPSASSKDDTISAGKQALHDEASPVVDDTTNDDDEDEGANDDEGPSPEGKAWALDEATLAAHADDAVEKARRDLHVPGISLTVVRDGHVVVQKGYGDAKVEPKTPMTKETQLAIASETKIFTTVAVLQLVEKKKLALEDALTKYVEGPKAWDGVTIRELLAMQSGIPHKKRDPDWKNDVAWAKTQPLKFAPGTKSDYSNTNFLLLGVVIEKVTGEDYISRLQKNVFAPAGIESMQLHAPPFPPTMAEGYAWKKTRFVPAEPLSPDNGFSSGGLIANALDFQKFDAALFSGKLLSKSSLDAMVAPQPVAADEKATRGLGWDSAHVVKGRRRVAKGGDLPGFKAWFAHALEEGVTVIIIGNAHDKKLNDVGRALFAEALKRKS